MKSKLQLADIIIFLLAILFIYASLSKLFILEEFRKQLRQSPLIPESMIVFISYFIPFSELIVTILLFIDKTKIKALYGSFFLMFAFTLYLLLLISIDETLPCSCGGILGKMGYHAHIVFNLMFCIIILTGIWLENRIPKLGSNE